jgi:hypothetical protein
MKTRGNSLMLLAGGEESLENNDTKRTLCKIGIRKFF